MGAGLSGIGAAYHLQELCPNKSYIILEQRERIGGTGDLFHYPGIRSDSDMLTMGYSFRPWTHPKQFRRATTSVTTSPPPRATKALNATFASGI